ncbi:MAG TPA: DUF1761 domain-containing protein [Chitinophagaceae bacterium]|jgi:hypothetical protein|nr:DUF1761 domain-containing protein [Chitinophagaceae bacterium]
MNTDLFSHINWLAVLVAAVAFFLLGALWYSLLFRDAWIKSSGVNMNDPNAKKGVGGVMTFSFILIVITTIGLALFISRIGSGGWMTGLKVGLIAGICFCATSITNSYLYEKRPMALTLINSFYNIVGCVIAGIIIAVWK